MGPRPFAEAEESLFFSREKIALELARKVRQRRFVALVAPVESGKSSLLHAGLAPLLGRESPAWELAWLRPGDESLQQIEAAVARRSLGGRVLAVVDPFDALAHDATFVQRLLASSRSRMPPVHVLVSFDGEPPLLLDAELERAVRRGRFELPRLERPQLRRTITGPIDVAGGQISHRLVERLLDDLGAEEHDLPLLQHTLRTLWDGSGWLDLGAYQELGGVRGAWERRDAEQDQEAPGTPTDQEAPGTTADAADQEAPGTPADAGAAPRETARDVDARIRRQLQARDAELARERERWEAEAAAQLEAERARHRDAEEQRRAAQHQAADEAVDERGRRLAEEKLRVEERRAAAARQRRWILGAAAAALLAVTAGWGFLAQRGATADATDAADAAQSRATSSAAEASRQRELVATAERQVERLRARVAELEAALERGVGEGVGRGDGDSSGTAGRDPDAAEEALRERLASALEAAREAARQARDAARLSAARRPEATLALRLQLLREVEASPPDTVDGWRAVAAEVLDALRAGIGLRHDDTVRTARFSADGERIVTASEDRTARLWNLFGSGPPVVVFEHDDEVHDAAFSPDGTAILTRARGREGRLWRVGRSGEPVAVFAPISFAVFSPVDTRVLTLFRPTRKVQLWSFDEAVHRLELEGHRSRIRAAAFSPDGRQILVGSDDATATIWDLGGPRHILRGHRAAVVDARYSADGRRIVTASRDATARVWDAAAETEPVVLEHDEPVASARFTPGDEGVLSVAAGRAWLWDLTRPEAPRAVGRSDDPGVVEAVLDPAGRRLLLVHDGGAARLWNVAGNASADEPLELTGHSDWIVDAAFSPDGQKVVTASRDGTARVHFLVEIPLSHPESAAEPASEVRRFLWRIAPSCLPAAERVRALGVDAESARRDVEGCAAMLRCLARGESFAGCDVALREAQAPPDTPPTIDPRVRTRSPDTPPRTGL